MHRPGAWQHGRVANRETAKNRISLKGSIQSSVEPEYLDKNTIFHTHMPLCEKQKVLFSIWNFMRLFAHNLVYMLTDTAATV